MRAFFLPRCAGQRRRPRPARGHHEPQGKENAMNDVGDSTRGRRQRAPSCCWPPTSGGGPGAPDPRPDREQGRRCRRARTAAEARRGRTRRLAASEGADRPSGSAYGNPLGGHAGHRPGRAHRSVLDREDRRPRCARVARLPGGASDHAVARRPGEPGAERPGEVPVAGGPAAVAASPSRAKAAAHDAPHREPRRPAVDVGRLPVVGHRCRVAAGRPA